MNDMTYEIRTEDMTVGYGRTALIRDICLAVRPGEILTLVGPNGSGKSTILKSITGQLEILGGRVYVCDRDTVSMRGDELAKKLAMVSTERLQPELMSCREVVETGRYPYTGHLGILGKADRAAVEEAIRLVHAKEVADRDFGRVSDGQRQRVLLARAICQDTDILVLDEPTSYLDLHYKLELLTQVRALARRKKLAVLMSLHELDLARQVSDRILCIEGDRVGRMGTPEEIFRGNYIQELYGIGEKSFDPRTGNLYLPAQAQAAPEFFVIGGGGEGIPIFEAMARQGIGFYTGILFDNDVEYAPARAMAARVIGEKAFCAVSGEKLREAKQLIDRCSLCISTRSDFGPLHPANNELLAYARECGKLKEAKEWLR